MRGWIFEDGQTHSDEHNFLSEIDMAHYTLITQFIIINIVYEAPLDLVNEVMTTTPSYFCLAFVQTQDLIMILDKLEKSSTSSTSLTLYV